MQANQITEFLAKLETIADHLDDILRNLGYEKVSEVLGMSSSSLPEQMKSWAKSIATVANTEVSASMEPSLKPFRITLYEEQGDQHTIFFDCEAEDADHAAEQAKSAYSNCEVSEINELAVTNAPSYEIVLPVHGIKINGAALTSNLLDGEESAEEKAAINAIEAMVLAHATAGVNVQDSAYLEGLETAIQAIWSRF